MTVNVAIFGAGGRMGEALLKNHNAVEGVTVKAGVLKSGHSLIGEDASRLFGGANVDIPLVSHVSEVKDIDVVIDFSRPEVTLALAHWCHQNGIALVTGTTGFTPEQKAQLQGLTDKIAIVHSNNMSPGVNLCFDVVADVARRLGDKVDVEILEAHHKHKIDAPSGTALRLGEAVADAWGVDLASRAVYTREGRTGEREQGTIGFATIRAGDIIGDHYVIFASEGERIEIVHKSTSRMHYAKGGLLAAGWVTKQEPGFYSMSDVLK